MESPIQHRADPAGSRHPAEPDATPPGIVLDALEGLIPSWSKDMSGAAIMINARSETAERVGF